MLTKSEIARLRSLREKKHRDALGLFAVEGEKVVAELLASGGAKLTELYTTDEWKGGEAPAGVDRRTITADEMARISHFPTPSTALAVGKIERATLEPEAVNRGRTLLLDGIQDAGNLGTLIRVADWFGLDRIVASPDCVDLYNTKVIHASMGSFSRVQVFTASLPDVLRHATVPVLGCDLAGTDVHGVSAIAHVVIAIGSEGRGLSEGVRSRVTRYVTIPRYGAAESLNAALAAAIVCDNLRRTAGAPPA